MSGYHPSRSAVGAAALCLTVLCGSLTGCATPRADERPRDVRVVDLSDEAAEKIAERVAAYLPQPPTGAQRVVVMPQAPRAAAPPPTQREIAGGARYPSPDLTVFKPVRKVARDRLRTAAAKSVDAALAWLARHQADDGAWNAAAFSEQCEGAKCSGPGEPTYTPGLTGMALLAFLGDGNTHRTGEYAETVRRALRYLTQIQDAEGCFGPRVSQHFQYNHALATLAMVNAYRLSESPLYKESAQSAVDFVQMSRNPYLGWRYGVRDGDNDTSMTAWMVMVLAEARKAGLTVDDDAFRGALVWVDKMTEPKFGRVGYNRRGGPPARTQAMMETFPADLSEAMTAAGLLIRLNAGQSAAESDAIRKGATLLAAKPPVWNVDRGSNDFYYWHLGAMAMSKIGGKNWDMWRSALHAAATEHQNTGDDGDAGSWDPVDAWSPEGGRVYATATLCLTLQQVEHSLR